MLLSFEGHPDTEGVGGREDALLGVGGREDVLLVLVEGRFGFLP